MDPTTMHSSRVRETIILVVLTAVLSFAFLGSRPFSTRGEPREALVAQEMFESGNYLLGSGYGGVVPSKPPFMHWFITAFSQITGEVTEWSSRAPSALASFAFLLAWCCFLRRRIGAPQALFATLLLATSMEWYRAATTTRVDMTLASLLGFSFIGLYCWWERKLVGLPVGTIIALWGATLTKGPVAIALPGAIFALFLLLRGEPLGRVIGRCLLVFVPALCGALLWYLAAYLERGPEFLDKVYYENFARLTSTQEDTPHDNSVLYLLGTIPLGLMPWTLLALPLLGKGLKGIQQLASPSLLVARCKAAFLGASPLSQFSTVAAVVFVIFFSIPSSKRSVYLLPVYPFFALGVAALLSRMRFAELPSTRVMLTTVNAVLATLMLSIWAAVLNPVIARTVIEIFTKEKHSAEVQELISRIAAEGLTVQTVMFGLLGLTVLYGAVAARKILQSQSMLLSFIGMIFVSASGSVMVLFSQQTSAKSFAPTVAELVPTSASLYSFGNEFYGLSFYLKREIRSLQREVAPETGSFVVLYERNIPALRSSLTDSQKLIELRRSSNGVDRLGRPLLLLEVR